jgi:N-acylneuraminate cytidylyltransferase
LKPLVVIPARGGSKGVPRKNIKLLGGKPLIQYTIEVAREIFDDNLICVSTDDLEILSVVEGLGLNVPFLRPKFLGEDSASTNDVLIHAIDYYEKSGYTPDTVILLQPTSPFRKVEHLKDALEEFDNDCEMLVSVKESKSNPYYTLVEENQAGWLVKSKEGNFTRRQDCPKVYEINGAIYIINSDLLKKKGIGNLTHLKKYVMDEISSLDIDDEIDWAIAKSLLRFKST